MLFTTAKQDYAKTNQQVPAENTPAKCYLEAQLEKIKDGELRAKALSDVIPKFEEDDVSNRNASRVDVLRQVPCEACDKEELGTKVRPAKNPEVGYLRDYEEDVFTSKTSHLAFLKSKVWQLKARDAQGVASISPSW